MSATIEIECRVCGDKLLTTDVDAALAFDRKHNETCPPSGDDA